MSARETPMIERLWDQLGGTLVEEYPVVDRSLTSERRCLDAIIFPNRERRRATWREAELRGQDVIVVQAKAHRLGLTLMGQGVFSPRLVERHGPKSVRGLILCGASDSNLIELLKPFGDITLQIDPLGGTSEEPMPERDRNGVVRYWQRVGGTLIEDFPIADRSATSGPRTAHGIILRQHEQRHTRGERISLEGEDVIIVHSRPSRLGMYIMGQALFAAELVKRHHKPRSIQSVALCRETDSVLEPLLKPFPEVQVVAMSRF